VIAHVGGVPVEEALVPVAGWAAAGLVLARAWLGARAVKVRSLFSRRATSEPTSRADTGQPRIDP
jgi:hypothetical protein